MLCAAIFSVVASTTAIDQDVPIISLGLAENIPVFDSTHDSVSGFPTAPKSILCHVLENTTVGAEDEPCREPNVSAWDHHEGDISEHIEKHYDLLVYSLRHSAPVINHNLAQDDPHYIAVNGVDNNMRGDYKITYDVVDSADNHAESVSFTMVMVDYRPPEIHMTDISKTYEACSPGNDHHYQDLIQFIQIPCESNDGTRCNARDAYDDYVNLDVSIEGQEPETCDGDLCHIIDTHRLGSYRVTARASDHANIFGRNYQDNVASVTYDIVVEDTTPPEIHVQGDIQVSCGATVDQDVLKGMAVCVDTHDSLITPSNVKTSDDISTQNPSIYDPKVLEPYLRATVVDHEDLQVWPHDAATLDVRFACSDINAGPDNSLTTVSQHTVTISDNSPPTLTITTGGDHQLLRKDEEVQVICNNPHNTLYSQILCRKWTGENVGLHYSLEELRNVQTWCNNSHFTECIVDDHVVQLSAGSDVAGSMVDYLMSPGRGYSCSDSCNIPTTTVDWTGPLGQFDTNVPGNYTLQYTCSDSANNQVVKERKIMNVDSRRPVIEVIGSDIETLEYSPESYSDDGAVCSDAHDPEPTLSRSGVEEVDLSALGTYVIKYDCVDRADNHAHTATRSIIVVDTKCPRCALADPSPITVEAEFPYTDQPALCSDLHFEHHTWNAHADGTVDTAHTGTYHVTYSTVDAHNLSSTGCNQAEVVKEVRVIDTLKPVIALQYDNQIFSIGDSSDRSDSTVHSGSLNPAKRFFSDSHDETEQGKSLDMTHNHNAADYAGPKDGFNRDVNQVSLMTVGMVTANNNAWTIGALVSGVTGVVLLIYSSRYQSQSSINV